MNTRQRFACAGLLIALSACNENTSEIRAGSLPPPPPPSPYTYRPCTSSDIVTEPVSPGIDELPGGIWHGSLTNELLKSTEPFTAIVADDGRFRLQSGGHTQFFGSLATDANEFSGDGQAYHGGNSWADGSLTSELSIAGAIVERQSMKGTWALASGDAGCFDFRYDAALYERQSSLELLSGTWSAYDDWGIQWTLTIDDDGNFVWPNPYSECTTTGHLAIIDDRYNLYEIQSASSSCQPTDSYTGLAYLFDIHDGSNANDQIYLSLDDGTTVLRLYWSR